MKLNFNANFNPLVKIPRAFEFPRGLKHRRGFLTKVVVGAVVCVGVFPAASLRLDMLDASWPRLPYRDFLRDTYHMRHAWDPVAGLGLR